MMIGAVIGILTISLTPSEDAVQLGHVYTKGEKLQYSVKANLKTQIHTRGVEQWIPEDLDINYKFTTETLELKPDGIAVVRYLRPSMTVIEGETFTAPPKTTIEKTNLNYVLTLSAINETITLKDETPKPKKTGGGGGLALHSLAPTTLQAGIGGFVGEVERLCLAVSPGDSGIDLAPKLSIDKVKVGDTWKRTVAYEPQKLKGKDGKQAVQRLDFTFVYKGVVDSNGRKVHRVTANIDLSTDLGDFINEATGLDPNQTGLKKFPLTMKGAVDFDLDLKTMKTLSGVFNSEGGFKIFTVDDAEEPSFEQKFVGKTQLTLVGKSME